MNYDLWKGPNWSELVAPLDVDEPKIWCWGNESQGGVLGQIGSLCQVLSASASELKINV